MSHAVRAPSRVWPQRWAAVLRDRLQLIRLLTLLLALLTLYAVAAAASIADAGVTSPFLLAGSIALLTALWVHGHRSSGLPAGLLPFELLALLGFTVAVGDDFGSFGAMFLALQHRALFGTRGRTVLVALGYAAVLVAAQILLPADRGSPPAVVALGLMVGAFAAYVMHTLGEALARDAERTLRFRDSEARFRSATNCLREAVLITDVHDRIVLANDSVLKVLGYEPSAVIGRNATDLLLPPAQRNAFRDRLRNRLSGQTELYEVELVRGDGRVIAAEVSASPYRDAAGAIVGTLGAISDITDRKRLEERLRHGMRLEAVGQLAGGVAHDFNNLLTVIKCHAELIRADLPQADPLRANVREIEHAADRAAEVTGQLLAFSRRQLMQPRRIDLEGVIGEALPVLRKLAGGRVEIRTLTDGSSPAVFADPTQLENVLVALVRNACEAMPAEGAITIETATQEMQARDLPLQDQHLPAGIYTVVVVRDTGVGMEAKVLERLFEPFFTTKDVGAGSGLGLASVFGTVRQSGGFVDVQSAPARGTTVRIYLPALAAAPALQTG